MQAERRQVGTRLPCLALRPPHRATSQGEVPSRPGRTRRQAGEPWSSEETHVVSPNTNTVGDGEKSKPSPGSQDIFLNRDNSRPGGEQHRPKAKRKTQEQEDVRSVRLMPKAIVMVGQEGGPQQRRRRERMGPASTVPSRAPHTPRGGGPLPPSHRGGARGSGG